MLGAIKLVSLSLHKTFYTLLVKCTTHQRRVQMERRSTTERVTFKGQDSGVTLFWVELCGWRRTERGMSCHPPAFLRPRLVPSSLLVFYNRNNKVLIKFYYMKTNMTVHEDTLLRRKIQLYLLHCSIFITTTRNWRGKCQHLFCFSVLDGSLGATAWHPSCTYPCHESCL